MSTEFHSFDIRSMSSHSLRLMNFAYLFDLDRVAYSITRLMLDPALEHMSGLIINSPFLFFSQ